MPFKSKKQKNYFFWKAKQLKKQGSPQASKWENMSKEFASHTDMDTLKELYVSKEFNVDKFNSNNDILYFVIFEGQIFFFKHDDFFIEKVNKFVEYISDKLHNKKYYSTTDIKDRYDVDNFFNGLSIEPNLFVSEIYGYGDKIICDIKSKYYDPISSGLLKKIIKILPSIDYFKYGDKKYTKNEILNIDRKKEILKLPDVIYHGTSSFSLKNILKTGIKPEPYNSKFDVKHYKYIFFTSSFSHANYYANVAISGLKYHSNNLPVVIEIDTSYIDTAKIHYDFDFYNSFIGKGNKYYDDVYYKTTGDYMSSEDKPLTNISNKYPGFKYGKIGYEGTIKPSAIKNIYVKSGGDYKKYSKEEYIDIFIKPNKNIVEYHITNNIPLTENIFRYGSDAYCQLLCEYRELYNKGLISLTVDELKLIEGRSGEKILHDGIEYILELPIVRKSFKESVLFETVLFENNNIKKVHFLKEKKGLFNDNKPFVENNTNRVFENTQESDLTWHFDNEDRIIKLKETTDWKIQFDNEFPVLLENNTFIPKGVYHRLIKGTGKLDVEVIKQPL